MAKKKDLDTEVNLVSFISLLSVLICSLLLTAIWVQIGTLDVQQAIGGQAANKQKKDPVLWAQFQKNGSILLNLKDSPKTAAKLRRLRVSVDEKGKWKKEDLLEHISAIQAKVPQLKTVLIQAQTQTMYEDVIGLMDTFKEKGLTELGISPL